jgi:hypothetical protein
LGEETQLNIGYHNCVKISIFPVTLLKPLGKLKAVQRLCFVFEDLKTMPTRPEVRVRIRRYVVFVCDVTHKQMQGIK